MGGGWRDRGRAGGLEWWRGEEGVEGGVAVMRSGGMRTSCFVLGRQRTEGKKRKVGEGGVERGAKGGIVTTSEGGGVGSHRFAFRTFLTKKKNKNRRFRHFVGARGAKDRKLFFPENEGI